MRRGLLFALAVLASLMVPVTTSYANGDDPHTHFRYGHYSWRPAGGTTIEFTIQNGFRRNGYSCIDPSTLAGTSCSGGDGLPGAGDMFAEFIGFTQFFPGDGSLIASPVGPLLYVVTSIDPANNWLFALALDPASLPALDTTISHTYAAPGDYLAFTDSCCRISAVAGVNAHINNPDGPYRVETVVNVDTGNSSPVSAMHPIVLCPIGEVCNFSVPGADPDGDALNFRLSTSSEAGGGFTQPGPLFAPNAATVSVSGVYTWDTTGATLGPAGTNTLYSTQVTIEDIDASGSVKSKVALDFLIQLVPCPPEGCEPPEFPPPPPGEPPVCNTTQVVNLGGTLTFMVAASDPNPADTVTLNVAGLPLGATMTPPLPTSGNPVSSDFSWTPTAPDVGTVVVNFTATSPDGSALCPVTIEVSAEPLDYVALGDSFSSGTGAGAYDAGTGFDVPPGQRCFRSFFAFPRVLDREEGAILLDVAAGDHAACHGATVADVVSEQFSRLTQETDIVTITIGGNDLRFSRVAGTCAITPTFPCLEAVALLNRSPVLSQLRSALVSLYQSMRVAAPNARIFVLGYPLLLSDPPGNCAGLNPIEQAVLRLFEVNLNSTIQSAVLQVFQDGGSNVAYVNVQDAFVGTELCTADSFVNGLVLDPRNPRRLVEESFHPNVDGHARLSECLAAAIEVNDLTCVAPDS